MKKISLQPVDHNTETQVPLSILREDLRIGPNCVKDCLALPLSTDRPMRKRPGAASIIPSAVRGGRRTAASAELALSPRPTPSTPSIDCAVPRRVDCFYYSFSNNRGCHNCGPFRKRASGGRDDLACGSCGLFSRSAAIRRSLPGPGQELIGRLLKMGFWMHSRTAQGATMRDRKAKNRLPARESDLGFRLHPDEDSRTSEVLIDDSDSWRQ
jgi:hypothetical protein